MSDQKTGDNEVEETVKRTDGGAELASSEESTRAFEKPVPKPLGERLAAAFSMDPRPETIGEMVEGVREWGQDREPWPPSFEDFADANMETRNVLEVGGETYYFHSALEPLYAPTLVDEEDMVIRSASPVEGAEVVIRIEGGEVVEVTPSTAVMSLGASESTDVGPDELVSGEAYEELCSYVNAFPNRTTYEAWLDDNPDVEAVAMPMIDGIELGRATFGSE